MEKVDKRIIKTKNKLTNSLLEIIAIKEIKNITVIELCQKAQINRTTFYKYYKDIDDFVAKIEMQLIDELKESIQDIKRNYLISYINKIIESIQSQKNIYEKLISDNGDKLFLKKILFLVHDQSINEWQRILKKANANDLENIYRFIVDGSIGIIENWTRNNFQENPTNITNFINKLCMSGLSSFI